MQALAKAKGIELTLAVEPGLPEVLMDERRLAQVLRNLFSNALKFTAEPGRVEVSVGRDRESAGFLRVAVRDTGRGISQADQERVFERLYQVADGGDSSPPGGMGLGLHISRELVLLHGGRIWVDSSPGEGSVFSFTLAVARDSVEPPSGRVVP